eukprot:Nk52_evm35s1705 gene=Nk52_evmTU35s1705
MNRTGSSGSNNAATSQSSPQSQHYQPASSKSKFSTLNINAVFKGTSSAKSPSQPSVSGGRHGMQVLGRVGSGSKKAVQGSQSAAPRPVNLPSLRRENAGMDPNTQLVPAGGSGWGATGSAGSTGDISKSNQSTEAESIPLEDGHSDPSVKEQQDAQRDAGEKGYVHGRNRGDQDREYSRNADSGRRDGGGYGQPYYNHHHDNGPLRYGSQDQGYGGRYHHGNNYGERRNDSDNNNNNGEMVNRWDFPTLGQEQEKEEDEQQGQRNSRGGGGGSWNNSANGRYQHSHSNRGMDNYHNGGGGRYGYRDGGGNMGYGGYRGGYQQQNYHGHNQHGSGYQNSRYGNNNMYQQNNGGYQNRGQGGYQGSYGRGSADYHDGRHSSSSYDGGQSSSSHQQQPSAEPVIERPENAKPVQMSSVLASAISDLEALTVGDYGGGWAEVDEEMDFSEQLVFDDFEDAKSDSESTNDKGEAESKESDVHVKDNEEPSEEDIEEEMHKAIERAKVRKMEEEARYAEQKRAAQAKLEELDRRRKEKEQLEQQKKVVQPVRIMRRESPQKPVIPAANDGEEAPQEKRGLLRRPDTHAPVFSVEQHARATKAKEAPVGFQRSVKQEPVSRESDAKGSPVANPPMAMSKQLRVPVPANSNATSDKGEKVLPKKCVDVVVKLPGEKGQRFASQKSVKYEKKQPSKKNSKPDADHNVTYIGVNGQIGIVQNDSDNDFTPVLTRSQKREQKEIEDTKSNMQKRRASIEKAKKEPRRMKTNLRLKSPSMTQAVQKTGCDSSNEQTANKLVESPQPSVNAWTKPLKIEGESSSGISTPGDNLSEGDDETQESSKTEKTGKKGASERRSEKGTKGRNGKDKKGGDSTAVNASSIEPSSSPVGPSIAVKTMAAAKAAWNQRAPQEGQTSVVEDEESLCPSESAESVSSFPSPESKLDRKTFDSSKSVFSQIRQNAVVNSAGGSSIENSVGEQADESSDVDDEFASNSLMQTSWEQQQQLDQYYNAPAYSNIFRPLHSNGHHQQQPTFVYSSAFNQKSEDSEGASVHGAGQQMTWSTEGVVNVPMDGSVQWSTHSAPVDENDYSSEKTSTNSKTPVVAGSMAAFVNAAPFSPMSGPSISAPLMEANASASTSATNQSEVRVAEKEIKNPSVEKSDKKGGSKQSRDNGKSRRPNSKLPSRKSGNPQAPSKDSANEDSGVSRKQRESRPERNANHAKVNDSSVSKSAKQAGDKQSNSSGDARPKKAVKHEKITTKEKEAKATGARGTRENTSSRSSSATSSRGGSASRRGRGGSGGRHSDASRSSKRSAGVNVNTSKAKVEAPSS